MEQLAQGLHGLTPRRIAAILAAALLTAAFASGCGASSSRQAATCTPLPAAIGPDVAGSLELTDSGGSYCLSVGERVNVFLKAPAGQEDDKWAPIISADPARLRPLGSGALTLVRGVTGASFEGVAPGAVHLTSTRDGKTWRADIVVR